MKQLLIAVMVSVVCSLFAVSWFTESKSSNNNNSSAFEKNSQRVLHGKEISKTKPQRQQKENSREKSHKHKSTIAGFTPSDLDHSLAKMTKKLALSTSQQSKIRRLLVNFLDKNLQLKKSYMQARKSIYNLDVLSKGYPKHKARLMKNVQYKLQEVLLFTLQTKEDIYANLNPTQQEILSNM